MWKAYIQLSKAENTFRIQKSDLSIRPIWNQKEERVRAHIFVCFLSYVLWKTLGQLCKKAGGFRTRLSLAIDISQSSTSTVSLSTSTILTLCLSAISAKSPFYNQICSLESGFLSIIHPNEKGSMGIASDQAFVSVYLSN